jgi:hypothetical protein
VSPRRSLSLSRRQVIRGLLFFPPANSVTFLLYYFLLPGLTISLVLAVGWVLQKYLPRFFQVITGGRG